MDQLIGLVIFIIIVGVANALQRRVEQKRQEMQDQEPKTRMEDLPESTRRQIFGDLLDGVPMAKPKEAHRGASPVKRWPGTPVAEEAPAWDERAARDDQPSLEDRARGGEDAASPMARSLEEELSPWEREKLPWETDQDQIPARPAAPARRPAPPRRIPVQPQRAPAQAQRMPTPAEERRKVVDSMRQALDDARRQRRGQAQRPGPARPAQRPVQQAAAPQAASVSASPQEPDSVQRRTAGPQQRAGMGLGAGRDPLQRLFCNLDNVRVGIIMHEILSPPVSMRTE